MVVNPMVDYLNNRIEALMSRVEYLEAYNEVLLNQANEGRY